MPDPSTPIYRRPPVIVGAVVALLALLGIAVFATRGGDDVVVVPTTTTRPTTTTTTTAPPTAPLTGLPVSDESVLDRPAMVVKVDNSTKARGRQAGLADADVVYVEKVEAGATRLAAVFHSTDSQRVGPVRSARTSDIEILANLNRPLFSFSGANSGVLRMVRGADIVDVGYDARSGSYMTQGSGVLRFFISTETLYGFAPDDAGPPNALFTHRQEGEDATAGELARGVRIAYGGHVGTTVSYEGSATGWIRSQDGSVHLDADDDPLDPENVIVQFTQYRASGFRDVTGASSPEAVLVGEGDAWILSGGRLVQGRWSRPDAASPTSYTDATGQPVALTPGRTWIELAPPGSATVVAPDSL
ncbi:MAG TPA: DUF3048 domain-containing protein [Acidimicrobiales bacterium]|nr:DUF3048 domain-containing protein [Acidimicrobiales bacterium]